MRMSKKPAILKKLSLNEYILAFKSVMAKMQCEHATGFVNVPLLFAPLESFDMEQLVNLALKDGVLVKDGDSISVNLEVYAFIKTWINSVNVVGLRKPSFSDQKGLFFARVEDTYLAILQDVKSDTAILAVDNDPGTLYDYFQSEIEGKDVPKNYTLKEINQRLEENERQIRLEVDPKNLIYLQSLFNASGKSRETDEMIHVGKKQLEEISVDEKLRFTDVKKYDADSLKAIILGYIENNTIRRGINDSGEDSQDAAPKQPDPEDYTALSFMKLTRSDAFPKSFFGFLKMSFVSIIKGLLNWKNLLKGVLVAAVIAGLTWLWNTYGLCFLNDTFYFSRRTVFGKATAYLLAGIGDGGTVIGLPSFVESIDTVVITAVLYYLLAVAVRSIIRDIFTGKTKSNLLHFFQFGKHVRQYSRASVRGVGYFIWVGIAVSAVLNMVVFNPFAVFLLALMLLFSCMKCEEGGIAPLLMVFNSSVRYKRVMAGKKRAPMFGEYQLCLLGISIGLFFFSAINATLWIFVDFNFWIRLLITGIILFLALVRLGLIKLSKPVATAIIIVSVIATQLLLLAHSSPLLAWADDGGFSESGSIVRLLQNAGWPTVVFFGAVLAAAAALGCFALGAGALVIAGAAAVAGVGGIIAASTNDKAKYFAYDLIWADRSKFKDKSPEIYAASQFFDAGISTIPIFGNFWGAYTGVRDLSYDMKYGDGVDIACDFGSLALDVAGCRAVTSKFSEIKDVAKAAWKNGDDVVDAVKTAWKSGDGLKDAAKLAKDRADDVVDAVRKVTNKIEDNPLAEQVGDFLTGRSVAKTAVEYAENVQKGNKLSIDSKQTGGSITAGSDVKPTVTSQTPTSRTVAGQAQNGPTLTAQTPKGPTVADQIPKGPTVTTQTSQQQPVSQPVQQQPAPQPVQQPQQQVQQPVQQQYQNDYSDPAPQYQDDYYDNTPDYPDDYYDSTPDYSDAPPSHYQQRPDTPSRNYEERPDIPQQRPDDVVETPPQNVEDVVETPPQNVEDVVDTPTVDDTAGEIVNTALQNFQSELQDLPHPNLSEELKTEILELRKEIRPAPEDYLESADIEQHLHLFDNGVVKIQSRQSFMRSVDELGGKIGSDDGAFVLPKDVAEKAINAANGDPRVLEEVLHLEPGCLEDQPVLIDVIKPSNIRMSRGTELEALEGQWLPGGFNAGGIPEAVIDQPGPGEYIVSNIFGV